MRIRIFLVFIVAMAVATECGVCYETTPDDQLARLLPCRHKNCCTDCIWKQYRATRRTACSYCNQQILSVNNVPFMKFMLSYLGRYSFMEQLKFIWEQVILPLWNNFRAFVQSDQFKQTVITVVGATPVIIASLNQINGSNTNRVLYSCGSYFTTSINSCV
jgi:hypothetical protein